MLKVMEVSVFYRCISRKKCEAASSCGLVSARWAMERESRLAGCDFISFGMFHPPNVRGDFLLFSFEALFLKCVRSVVWRCSVHQLPHQQQVFISNHLTNIFENRELGLGSKSNLKAVISIVDNKNVSNDNVEAITWICSHFQLIKLINRYTD